MDHFFRYAKILPLYSLTRGYQSYSNSPKLFMVEIDFQSSFHQLKMSPLSQRFLELLYHGQKYSYTRLPIDHDLAPGIFQQFARTILSHVCTSRHCKQYLPRWLVLYHQWHWQTSAWYLICWRAKNHYGQFLRNYYLGFMIWLSSPHVDQTSLQAYYDRLLSQLRRGTCLLTRLTTHRWLC